MNRTTHFRSSFNRNSGRPRTVFGALEWEELPSLSQALRRSEPMFAGSVWTETQRMELHSLADVPLPAPFAEPIDGLHVREIEGYEVFRHFFGGPGTSH